MLTQQAIIDFCNQYDYDIRKSGNGRWIDQKCAADVVTVVADCIYNYALQDEYGNVLPEYLCEAQDNWKQVWNGGNTHYGELDLPSAPDKAGSYVLSIYFSGDFIATTSFTIAE